MNAKKLISMGITLAALSMLTACEAGPVTPGTPGTPASNQPGTPQTATSNATMNILPGEGTQAATIGQTISEANMAAYAAAQQLKDATYCDKISDAKYKSQCVTDLSDLKYLDAALNSRDTALCKNLSSQDRIDACKIQVDVIVRQISAKEQEQSRYSQEQAMTDTIVQSGDYAQCQDLQDETFIKDCEYNILIKLAFSNKDASWCQKASLEIVRESCAKDYADLKDRFKSSVKPL